MLNLKEEALKIAELVEEKNKAYGSAFNKTQDFLKILYPDGIKPEQYHNMLFTLRIFDKLMRISHENANSFNEDARKDILRLFSSYGV